MELSQEEQIDYIRFFEGGEMPDNAALSIRPALSMLRAVSWIFCLGNWGRSPASGFLFALGRRMYKRNRMGVKHQKVITQKRKLRNVSERTRD
jgi:hypothetical protein